MQGAKEAIEWIKSLRPFGIKPGTERMEWMLDRLGNPERRLKFVHIAGTNGKGSTTAYLASVLRKAGYDVGMFRSPHTLTYLDRITYNGEPISDDALIEICSKLKELAEELKESSLGIPTEFEILTTAAILYFAKYTYPDIVVWETGLGGRMDSTNVVVPLISIITNVDYDHMHILGDSLQAIAREKAGIIKSGVPVVTAIEHPEAMQVIEEEAKNKRAKVYRFGEEFYYEDQHIDHLKQTFSFVGPFCAYRNLGIRMLGVHQFTNASLSIMALEVLRQYYAFLIEEEHLVEGLLEAQIPGRMEIVSAEPMIVFDGAHNPHGAKALASSIPKVFHKKRLIMVLSIMQDKRIDEMLDHLLPLANEVILTKAHNKRAIDISKLSELIRSKKPQMPIYIEEEPDAAMKKALSVANKDDLVLVAGSLYLIENIREACSHLFEIKVGDRS